MANKSLESFISFCNNMMIVNEGFQSYVVMRDIRKTRDYFDRYLQFQYSRIEKGMSRFKKSSGENKQRILTSLTSYMIDLLKAEFSFGASKKTMKTLFNQIIPIVNEYKKITYDDLLLLLSLSIILDEKKNTTKLIDANMKLISSDRLLSFFVLYIKNGNVIWDTKIKLVEKYSNMDEVFLSLNKTEAMNLYLNKWYANNSETAWYNSHLRDTETYCGYWSFESAAVSKILGLDDAVLRKSVYYPVL